MLDCKFGIFNSVAEPEESHIGSGSGVSIHWMWMVPTDPSQVLRLQLAFPARPSGHFLVVVFWPLGKG